MAKGSYLGGSTVIHLGSHWFSGHAKKQSKDRPASQADLDAGARIRAGLKSRRAKQPAQFTVKSAAGSLSAAARNQEKKKRKAAEAKRLEAVALKKAADRKAQQAVEKVAREKKRIRKELAEKRLAEQRADPEFQAALRERQKEKSSKRMKNVIVERRLASGKVLVERPGPQKSALFSISSLRTRPSS